MFSSEHISTYSSLKYTHIYERNPIKEIYEHHFKKLVRILTFISNIARRAHMFLVGICWCVRVSFILGLSNPYICGNVGSLHFRHTWALKKPKTVNDHDFLKLLHDHGHHSSFQFLYFSIFLSPLWQTWRTSNICSPTVVCDFQCLTTYMK